MQILPALGYSDPEAWTSNVRKKWPEATRIDRQAILIQTCGVQRQKTNNTKQENTKQ